MYVLIKYRQSGAAFVVKFSRDVLLHSKSVPENYDDGSS
jgi:hypothetical protein